MTRLGSDLLGLTAVILAFFTGSARSLEATAAAGALCLVFLVLWLTTLPHRP